MVLGEHASKKRAIPDEIALYLMYVKTILKFWTCSYQSLTSLVALVLLEVLDEAASEILSLLVPLCCVSVSVTRIAGRCQEGPY